MKAIQTKEVKTKNVPNCTHSSLSKEYNLASATGDYICDFCGETISRNEKLERKKNN